MSPADLTRIAELVEAEVNYRLDAAVPEPTRRALGITTGRIGGGTTVSVRNDPTGGIFNKSLGLGVTESITDKVISEVLDFHRAHGSPMAHIQIAPELLPSDWAETRAVHGLEPGGELVRFAAEVDDVKPAGTDLRVGLVGAQETDEWAARLWEFFGVPDQHLIEVFAAVARTDGFQAFAAWDGDHMIGVANLFLHGKSAHLNSGATRESHRRRGVQSALIAARAEYAAAAGCRWLVSEVGKPEVEGTNPSLNNMARAGFTRLYDRRSWIWRPASTRVTTSRS
ncbi:GNAT family N-acetyltransferase [Micromonospora sp. B9E7]|uniref:GNAT family N-acetyltransferase n=1 Tax=Micromonospora sp. B9E7 TaxID=3153574 RepID=UPI00325DA0EB